MTCPGIKVPHPAGPQASPDLNVIKEKYTKQPLFLTEKKSQGKIPKTTHSFNSIVTKTLQPFFTMNRFLYLIKKGLNPGRQMT